MRKAPTRSASARGSSRSDNSIASANIVSDPVPPAQPSPFDLLTFFRARCEARALLVANGVDDMADAVDALYRSATAQGLDQTFGENEIQAVMAAAFEDIDAPAETNGATLSDAIMEGWEAADAGRAEQEARDRERAEVPIGIKPWWRDAATIPARRFLDRDRHYCRGTVGASIAAGGRGKTTRASYEAISFGLGRDLATGQIEAREPLRVLLLNGEEEQDELDRRVAATCQHYRIQEDDLGGRLFVKSVCNTPLRIAKLSKASGMAEVDIAVMAQIETMIRENSIDVIMIDPLISFHGVIESSNEHMDVVIKQGFGSIAKKTSTHCEVFHHPGKPKPGQADTLVEDGRGASAILWAVRSARVFNFMSPQDATKLGISEDERRTYIRIANGKANMGPLGKAKWMRLAIEKLPNGDEIAVASSWSPPNPFDGVSTSDLQLAEKLAATGGYRADSRSPKWFGYALADHLRIAVAYKADNDPKDLARINSIIKTWIKNKVLRIETRKDGDSKEREFIVLSRSLSATEIDDDDDEIV